MSSNSIYKFLLKTNFLNKRKATYLVKDILSIYSTFTSWSSPKEIYFNLLTLLEQFTPGRGGNIHIYSIYILLWSKSKLALH